MTTFRWGLAFGLLAIMAPAGAVADSTPVEAGADRSDWRQDRDGFESVPDPAAELFRLPEPWSPLLTSPRDDHGADVAERIDRVLTVEHAVPVGDGETIRLHESFTLRSWLRKPKRAVLFLSGTAVSASGWRIPVDGYDGPGMAARRGMFAFTLDYLGVGDHYVAGAHADESTFERNLAMLKDVLRYIRSARAVPRIDLVGESWGGAFATQLAADADRVRTCVMSSMTYQTVSNPVFTSPPFIALLASLEDGYLPSNPAFLEPEMAGAPQAVKDYVHATQTGPRLTAQLHQFLAGLPHFDPGVARVPGLVISGSSESTDGQALAADYGADGAQFFEIPDGGHVPRLKSPAIAKSYWDRIFTFIDSHE